MVFPLDEDFARRLLRQPARQPARKKMRRKNFALGYVSTSFAQCDYLNASNQYRKLTPATQGVAERVPVDRRPPWSKRPSVIPSASPRRVSSSSSPTGRLPTGTSTAGPSPCARSSSCRRAAESNRARPGFSSATARSSRWRATSRSGCCSRTAWCCTRRSRAWRCASTIEFDIVPARQTSFDVVDAGLGGWYPHFPTEAELQAATRHALQSFLAEVPEGAPIESWLKRVGRSLRHLRRRRRRISRRAWLVKPAGRGRRRGSDGRHKAHRHGDVADEVQGRSQAAGRNRAG